MNKKCYSQHYITFYIYEFFLIEYVCKSSVN